MRATVRDSESLSALRPLELVSYLRASGWRQQQVVPDRSATWVKRNARGEEYELLLPLARFQDFPTRISDLLRTLELAEDRSQIEILNDLTSTAADIVRVVSQNPDVADGSIPVDDAVALIEKSRDMMLAAACSVIEHRAYYPPRKFGRALDYLRGVRIGQTERGSYIVTILSRVPPALAEVDRDVPAPYERQVTQLLASGLNHVHTAAVEAAASGSMDAFRAAINVGVSANLCDAVVGMAGGVDANRSISMNFSWSRTRPQVNQGPPRVIFQADEIPLIFEAGRILRESTPIEEFEVEGSVIALDRPGGEEVGTVTVLGFVDERPRRIRMQLRDPDYHIAVQAHDQRVPVYCVGELVKEGRTFNLQQPRHFRLFQAEQE